MKILTAPYYALFSIGFYRRVIASKVGKGILYLLFLSGVLTLTLLLLFMVQGLPALNQFVDWFKAEMPIITITPEGVSIDIASPYTMVHPELGPLVTFDMEKIDMGIEEMGEVPVFVTAANVFVRQGTGEVRVYDLTEAALLAEERESREPIFVTPETVERFYHTLRPWVAVILSLFFFVFFFVWKLLAALFYSWIGLLINLSRVTRLPFASVYMASIFAMTASILVQWLRMVIPILGRIPFGLLGSIILTSIYLFIAIKKTEEIPSES